MALSFRLSLNLSFVAPPVQRQTFEETDGDADPEPVADVSRELAVAAGTASCAWGCSNIDTSHCTVFGDIGDSLCFEVCAGGSFDGKNVGTISIATCMVFSTVVLCVVDLF